VPFGPIEPVPSIGLTTRVNWLPTQLQANFMALIKKRIVGSLLPTMDLRRSSEKRARTSSYRSESDV
jgi:hypothetical protein